MSNYLDTRDLYKRQCELQEELTDLEMERDDVQEAVNTALEALNECEDAEEQEFAADALNEETSALEDAEKALADWLEENKEELAALEDAENEVGREWMHGATLIHEDAFKDYAMDLADDLHGRDSAQSWPFNCIDWDQAADALRQNYTEVDFQGETYLFRS